jgi:hypothetical protein
MKKVLICLLGISWICSFGLGQTEGISKETVTELLKRIRRGAESTEFFIGELPSEIADLSLALDDFTIFGGFQESYQDATFSEAYLDYQGNWQVAAQEIQEHLGVRGWHNVSSASASWGFNNGSPILEYADFCQGNTHFNYFFEPTSDQRSKATFHIDHYAEGQKETYCEEENETIEAHENIIDLPPLLLKSPEAALILTAENLPYSDPVPTSEVMGVSLPGGWASRTSLATQLSPADVLLHYQKQMTDAGWHKIQTGSTPLQEWSELELIDERGQKWLGSLSITHHEAYPGVVMPILMVLEKP